jgi:subtilisin family serine protease
MSNHIKISSAFDAFLADSGPNDKRDAIVIYRVPQDAPPRSESKDPADRLNYVKARAERQRKVHASVVEAYRREGPRRLAKRLAGRLELAASSVGSDVLPVSQVEVTRKTLPALAAQPDVVAILPNQKLRPIEPRVVHHRAATRAERNAGLTWGLKTLGVPALWNTTEGEQINVAVFDTGVHGDHPCLSGRVRKFLVIDPLGRRIEATPSFDGARHGTHVCGTIAGGKTSEGISIGVAPRANLLVAGVLLGKPTLRTLVEGMAWAVENGAHIINMSLGLTYYEPKFAELFRTLIHHYDILPVVAVGNENHGNTSSPGNASNALSVGAAERTAHGGIDVAFFSSGASLVFPGQANPLVTKPDLFAPGVGVYSCIPPDKQSQDGLIEYSYMDGSSMASPHVAGVAALLMAAHRNATVSDISTVLKETARHPGGPDNRPDNRWGWGMIRPRDALGALSS